ncbi:MAG: glycine zipper 2TM domain-containing protein [Alphaproteobacteria bacterium]|nr:glycine zipper 2TM domain-containing protein [Alphaproteobacteria bacterium]
MKMKIIVLAAVSALTLSGCAQNGEQNSWGMGTKQTVGTAGGAILGGFLGSKVGHGGGQLWATGAGALLGAFAGSEIGKSLDKADMAYHEQAVQQAYTAPLNQTISWNNPQSGHSGSITPVREGTQASTGDTCREFKQAIMIDGQAQTAVSTACRNPDGTWTVEH